MNARGGHFDLRFLKIILKGQTFVSQSFDLKYKKKPKIVNHLIKKIWVHLEASSDDQKR